MRPKKTAESSERPAPRKPRRAPEEIRARILEAAGDAFKELGYTGATTLTIARRADVTEAQLFRYFGTKAALFREAVFEPLNRHFDGFDARYPATALQPDEWRAAAKLYIGELQQFIGEHSKMLLALLFAQTYAPASMQGRNETDSLQSYFERGAALSAKRSRGKAKIEPKLMVRASFAAVLACILFKDWMFPAGLASEAEINEAIAGFVIDGIGVDLNLSPPP